MNRGDAFSNDIASKQAVSHIAEDGSLEYVEDHLREVAELASEFAKTFGAGSWAYAAGIVHDVGKYSIEFQNRILHGGCKVDHSTAGAFELANKNPLLAFCVAGHHGGLPNGGSSSDVSSEATLIGRVKKAKEKQIPDYCRYGQIVVPKIDQPLLDSMEYFDGYSLAFLTRMVFSCLVDADYLCTERFVKGIARQPLTCDSLEELSNRLESKIAKFYPPASPLNKARCGVLDACAKMAGEQRGVFSLTVPTGGGKTYASMRFALRHAIYSDRNMQRVIYAIPYTSIIEQNASVFREVLGDNNVLEHHSNFDFDSVEDGEADEIFCLGQSLRLASENWNAPIVITTNVQLFESLYSNKTSQCRKLHNLANSVIVLDEAQMLPTELLKPCVRSLAELVHLYGCTVVLCTATQPSLDSMFEEYGCSVREIVPNVNELFEGLRRVKYCYDGRLSDKELSNFLASHKQALCVVNNRKQAKNLYKILAGDSEEKGTAFHLSTLMYPAHREKVLAHIRCRLAQGEPCKLISTSLIEAGVDVDFPVVYRALSGIDSIVQCAGRCNREGRRSLNESIVHIFETSESYTLPQDIENKIGIAKLLMAWWEEESDSDIASFDFGNLKTITKYFTHLYKQRDFLDKNNVCDMLTNWDIENGIPTIPFKDAADSFCLIEDSTSLVIIPHPDIEKDLKAFQEGQAPQGSMRRMSRYGVGLYESDIRSLCDAGAITPIIKGVYLLIDKSLYRQDVGLDVSDIGGKALFF